MKTLFKKNLPESRPEVEEDSGSECEDFCRECDALYNKLVDVDLTVTPPAPVTTYRRFKKDCRTWLHKNPCETSEGDEQTSYDNYNEDDYEYAYSIINRNGRRFKKDSRVWLHKMSKRAGSDHCNENTSCDKYLDEDSLTAMSQITIGKQKRKEMEKVGKHCIECIRAGLVEKMIIASLQRTRKRRKMGASSPLSMYPGYEHSHRHAHNCPAAHKHRRADVVFSVINEDMEDGGQDSFSSNRCSASSSVDSLDELKQMNWMKSNDEHSPLTSEGCCDLANDGHMKAARYVLSCSNIQYFDHTHSHNHDTDDSASCDTTVDSDENVDDDLPAPPEESMCVLNRQNGDRCVEKVNDEELSDEHDVNDNASNKDRSI